jgi:hypothetical protein
MAGSNFNITEKMRHRLEALSKWIECVTLRHFRGLARPWSFQLAELSDALEATRQKKLSALDASS